MKGDAFEQMVDTLIDSACTVNLKNGFLSKEETLKLLRAQHRKVRRMVQRIRTCNNMDTWISKRDILAALERMVKGTKEGG